MQFREIFLKHVNLPRGSRRMVGRYAIECASAPQLTYAEFLSVFNWPVYQGNLPMEPVDKVNNRITAIRIEDVRHRVPYVDTR